MSPPGLPSYSKLGGGGIGSTANLYHVPASPPPDKLRSTTLFDMISHDQLDHQQQQMYPPAAAAAPSIRPVHHSHLQPPPLPAPPQQGLQERVSALLSTPIGSAPLVFNDPTSGDVRLTIVGRDGFNITVAVHRRALVGSSRYLAAKLSLASPDSRRAVPSCVEISDCDDVELYLLTVRLMYAADLKRALLDEGVPRVLGILKVAAAIGFEPATVACLEYLEAVPWPEEDEQRIACLVCQLRRDYPAASRGVLKRLVGPDGDSNPTPSVDGGSHEELLLRLLQCVLSATNDRARAEMKSLVSRLLRENVAAGAAGLSAGSLNTITQQCLDSLVAAATDTVAAGADVAAPPPLSRLVDGLQWLAEVLIDRGMGAGLVAAWASQAKLAELRRQLPAMQRRELSRVTARLVVALGRGLVMATAGDRSLLLRTWLEPLMDDFTWLQQRSCVSSAALDKRSVEEGVCQTILTLPVDEQGSILMDWFRRFGRDGDACPNLHRAFEVWWRRTFLASRSLKQLTSSHQ